MGGSLESKEIVSFIHGTDRPKTRAPVRRLTYIYIAVCIIPWIVLPPLFHHRPSLLSLSSSSKLSPNAFSRPVLSSDSVTPGVLSDVLYNQGLSHLAFHLPAFKLRLASLVRKSGTVAVVGVQYGNEVVSFAKAGYEVHGFEAMDHYYQYLLKRTITWPHVYIYHVAAGSRTGGKKEQVNYFTKTSNVSYARLDDYLSGKEIDVLSVDIQGNELDVLKGASKVKVRSYWIETGCNPKNELMLALLAKSGYIMFDFVPWGSHKSGNIEVGERININRWQNRPGRYMEYLSWICATQKNGYHWLQTDILAVRKDVVTDRFLEQLSTIGNDAFVDYIKENGRNRKK